MLRLTSLLAAAIVVVMAAFGQIDPEGRDDIAYESDDGSSGLLARSDGTVILTPEEIDRIAVEAALERARQRRDDVAILREGESRAARMSIDNIEQVTYRPDPDRLAVPAAAIDAAVAHAIQPAAADATGDATAALHEFLASHVVTGSAVNLREGPGTSYARLEALPRGTRVEVLSRNVGGWARLRLADGTTGFMASNYLGAPDR